MMEPFEMARQIDDARLKSFYNAIYTFALSAFMVGVALTHILEHYWPNSSRYLLLAATTGAFVNASVKYWRLRLSRKACKEHLAELRTLNPELAAKLEEFFR
jgi:hypothetical protein